MNRFSRIVLLIICMICTFQAQAQEQTADMADVMRSNGKIYVVVAVCMTILMGLFLYVWNVDRKISKMERD